MTTNDVFTDTSDVTYYAHWEITEVFSVTVPVVLPLTVDENGEVHTGAAEIINASTGAVVVSSVSISTKNGWQLVPFATDLSLIHISRGTPMRSAPPWITDFCTAKARPSSTQTAI